MQVQFLNVPLRFHRLFKKLFATTLRLTGNEVNASVCVKFVTEEEIRALNNEHRKVDRVTDVLSFPMLDITAQTKLDNFKTEALPNGIIEIGDIALCAARAKTQAKEYGHSYKREVAFLIVHGYLHLLGYDHINENDEKVMMCLAENILLNHGLER